jgi:hypothetical protein
MAKTAEERDEVVRGCGRLILDTEKIWKHIRVGKGRIAAIRDGHPLCHGTGRREKPFPEVISVTKTHSLLDAKIDDGEMARMVNDCFHFDGGPVPRQMVCEVRNKLKIICRPPFQVHDVRPEHAAMRYTFVKQIEDWRRAGIIKNLIFSDESRFCGGPPTSGFKFDELLGMRLPLARVRRFRPVCWSSVTSGWDSRARSPAMRRGLARRSTWGGCGLAV